MLEEASGFIFMKRLVFFILLFVGQYCLAQNQYIVLAERGLNVRESPDRNSKILAYLPYGKVVNSSVYGYHFDESSLPPGVCDTIDSIIGNWIDVQYDNISGYAFSPFLYVFNDLYKIDTLTEDSPIKITKEGFYVGNCEFVYHPKLSWYALYKDSVGFRLNKVNINLRLSKVEGLEKYKDQDCLMPELPEGIELETDRNEQSLFLIALHGGFTEGVIDSPFYNFDIEYDSDKGFLYPEQIKEIRYNKNSYVFRAFDSVNIDDQGIIVKKYQIELIKSFYSREGKNSQVINLSGLLDLYGTGYQHSYYKTPKIYWTGELNKDGILDFIIYQHTMADHGGVEWRYTLFLSNLDESGKLKYIIANSVCWGCH
jgi:hypothetical protein